MDSHPSTMHATEYNRSNSCKLLLKESKPCSYCQSLQMSLNAKSRKELKRKSIAATQPAKPKAPISLTSPERFKTDHSKYP